MPASPHTVLFLGASAGGLKPAAEILSALDADLPVAAVVVLHLSAHVRSYPVDALQRSTAFAVRFAKNEDVLEAGAVYVAPPDCHLLVEESGDLRVHFGPRVNRVRPAADLAFRSGAVAYGARAIGCVLSGFLDDGAAGLSAIKRCGGIACVQDPDDADVPEMPRNALLYADADHVEAAANLGRVINELGRRPTPPPASVPADLRREAQHDLHIVANADRHEIPDTEAFGTLVPMTCPDCDGPLWEVDAPGPARFRCHVGHGFGPVSLLDAQQGAVEEALWVAVRTLEERHRMLDRLARTEADAGRDRTASMYEQRAVETETHVERLRAVLQADGQATR